MTGIAWSLVRAGGRARALLLAGATALTSGLLLAAVSILLVPTIDESGAVVDLATVPATELGRLVAEPGTRGGTAFAVALAALAPLLLLAQAVRLGTDARERRLAALRLAGATPGQVRRLGALEVGIPVTLGALAGVLVYQMLRLFLGPATAGLLPASGPGVWGPVILVGAALLGVGVGTWAGRRVVATPLDVARRTRSRRPAPWGVTVFTAGLACGTYLVFGQVDDSSTVVAIAAVTLFLVGVAGLTPWVAWRAAQFVARRTSSAPTLLAARRIEADAGAAGRAAAAVGVIGIVAGGVGAFLAGLFADPDAYDMAYFLAAVLAICVALLATLVVATLSLAVHSVETLLARRRSIATLAALGTDEATVVASQRHEVAIVAVPVGVVGALLGGALLGSAQIVVREGDNARAALVWLGFEVGVAALVAVLLVGASAVAVRVVRPWTRRILDPAGLRTE